MINLNIKGLTKEQASVKLYNHLCTLCKAEGLNPNKEVFITDDYKSRYQISEGEILVSWESGYHQWGSNLSLGCDEDTYDPEFADKNLNWYLNSYHHFDVIFKDA